MHMWVVIRVERLISVSRKRSYLKLRVWMRPPSRSHYVPDPSSPGGAQANGKSLSGDVSHKCLSLAY